MSSICRTCLSEITSNRYVDINGSEFARKQLTLCIPELDLDLVLEPVLCLKCVEVLNATCDFKDCCVQTEQRIHAHMQTLTIEQEHVELDAVLGTNYNGINSMTIGWGNDIINDLNTVHGHSRTRHDLEYYKDAKGECSVTSQNCSKMSFDNDVKVNYDYFKEESIEIQEHELELQDCSRSSQKHDVDSKEQLKGLLQQYNELDPVNYNANDENCNSATISAESSTKHGNCVTNSQVGAVSIEPNISSSSRSFSKCDECDYTCSRKGNLITHKRATHTGKETYKFNECDYECSKTRNLKTHLKTHTGERPYKCDQCDYACSQKRSLIAHIRTHTGERLYKCGQCDYTCSIKSNLKLHLRTHTGERPYKCNVCNYAFPHKSTLKLHLRTHTGEKPYKCDQCDYACTMKSDLIIHIRNHTGEKPYKCNVCNYACSKTSILKLHLRTHTGEKPYTCDQCDYACSIKSNLKLHMLKHTGEKPYKCNVCNYASSQKSRLKPHMRTHTGEKPYKCHVCYYASSEKHHLNKHLRTHTREKQF